VTGVALESENVKVVYEVHITAEGVTPASTFPRAARSSDDAFGALWRLLPLYEVEMKTR
jgi:hypothetical protein